MPGRGREGAAAAPCAARTDEQEGRGSRSPDDGGGDEGRRQPGAERGRSGRSAGATRQMLGVLVAGKLPLWAGPEIGVVRPARSDGACSAPGHREPDPWAAGTAAEPGASAGCGGGREEWASCVCVSLGNCTLFSRVGRVCGPSKETMK